jgi:hypothetical protein
LEHDFVPLGTPLCGSSMEDVMPDEKFSVNLVPRDSLPLKSSTIVPKQDNTKEVCAYMMAVPKHRAKLVQQCISSLSFTDLHII